MKKTPYKSLDQLVGGSEERVPLSTRVKKETKAFLDREAKARKLTVSEMRDLPSWLRGTNRPASGPTAARGVTATATDRAHDSGDGSAQTGVAA